MNIGDFVESKKPIKNEGGKWTTEPCMSPKCALHIECSSRFICGDEVVLAKSDLYEPTSAQAKNEDFDWEHFDWDVKGQNRYDELAAIYFSSDAPKWIVKKVSVNRLGDLKLYFTNNFELQVLIDTSEYHKCWRFFETGNSNRQQLVVSG